jgi:hypothetical protein
MDPGLGLCASCPTPCPFPLSKPHQLLARTPTTLTPATLSHLSPHSPDGLSPTHLSSLYPHIWCTRHHTTWWKVTGHEKTNKGQSRGPHSCGIWERVRTEQGAAKSFFWSQGQAYSGLFEPWCGGSAMVTNRCKALCEEQEKRPKRAGGHSGCFASPLWTLLGPGGLTGPPWQPPVQHQPRDIMSVPHTAESWP